MSRKRTLKKGQLRMSEDGRICKVQRVVPKTGMVDLIKAVGVKDGILVFDDKWSFAFPANQVEEWSRPSGPRALELAKEQLISQRDDASRALNELEASEGDRLSYMAELQEEIAKLREEFKVAEDQQARLELLRGKDFEAGESKHLGYFSEDL